MDNSFVICVVCGLFCVLLIALENMILHKMTPEQFLQLLSKDNGCIVFYCRLEGRTLLPYKHRYNAYVRGCRIYTYSTEPLELPDHCEVIQQNVKVGFDALKQKRHSIYLWLQSLFAKNKK